MLTPRPDKFRGAWAYAAATGTLTTAAAVLYIPPASGALVRTVSADLESYWGVCSANQIVPLAFNPVGSTDQVFPHWGPDYALTGSFQGGRVTTVPLFFFSTAGQGPWAGQELRVFPPNVFIASASLANLAADFALEIEEFLSAEELQNWRAVL